jgi:FkbM family methyltransferase
MRFAEAVVRNLHRFAAIRAIGKRLLRRRTIRQPFHGGVICLDAVDHSWAWTGAIRLETWDRPIQDRLLALSRDCETMIDVGGSIGTMALSVALRNGGINIVTIEPNARAAALVRQSVRLNRLDRRVTVVEAIAAAADGELPFEETGSATGHVALAGAASAYKPAIDFGRLVADAAGRARCLVKIDVEGFETTLLERLPGRAARQNLVVFVELHALGFNGFGDPERCVAMLRDSGAVIRRNDDGAVGELRNWRDPISTVQVEARWA